MRGLSDLDRSAGLRWSAGLILLTVLAANGCCLVGPTCTTGHCGSGPGAGPLVTDELLPIDGDGPYLAGPAAEDQFPAACGTCGHGGLADLVLPLLSSRLSCGSGCGGLYWNEWISDPPECCDPCNDHGCWVGPQFCQQQRLLHMPFHTVRHVLHGLFLGHPACGDCGAVHAPDAHCPGCEDPGPWADGYEEFGPYEVVPSSHQVPVAEGEAPADIEVHAASYEHPADHMPEEEAVVLADEEPVAAQRPVRPSTRSASPRPAARPAASAARRSAAASYQAPSQSQAGRPLDLLSKIRLALNPPQPPAAEPTPPHQSRRHLVRPSARQRLR